jgi:hypothetical protein
MEVDHQRKPQILMFSVEQRLQDGIQWKEREYVLSTENSQRGI